MRSTVKDITRKTYDYMSRYSKLDTYYHNVDKKRYYATSKPLDISMTSYVTHTVGLNDTLDVIALNYYGTPLYWWVIADVNHIIDPLKLSVGMELKIPPLSALNG